MTPITGYRCDYCCRKRYTGSGARRRMEAHEYHCFGRPDRTPRMGELYGRRHVSRDEEEPAEWEPGHLGSIYLGPVKGWLAVPGYDLSRYPHWPWTLDGRLDQLDRDQRLRWYRLGSVVTTSPPRPYTDVPF